jgi:hypothetical protein
MGMDVLSYSITEKRRNRCLRKVIVLLKGAGWFSDFVLRKDEGKMVRFRFPPLQLAGTD